MTAGRSSGAAPWPFLFIPEQCSRSNPVSSIYNVLVAGMYEFSGALHSESSKFAAAAVLQGLPVRKNLTAKNVKKGTYSVHEKSIDFMNGI